MYSMASTSMYIVVVSQINILEISTSLSSFWKRNAS